MQITRADVEVQPYAFTTKSLYVGHTDYKYLRWQVIDTPGILDHPLEERNVIEMQAVTALAHLRAAVLYIFDISEQCGHTLEEQLNLFESIRPLFANKPLIVVINKVDVLALNDLPPNRRKVLETLENDPEIDMLEMSTVNDMGVMEVKTLACEKLLSYRVDQKMRTKKVDGVLNRLHVAVPKPRDDKVRLPTIPDNILKKRQANQKKLERHIEEELGDDYVLDLKKNYKEVPEEERYDIIPEIWEGHNVADYIDPDIFEKLEELEREEAFREESGMYVVPKIELDDTIREIKQLALQIRHKKAILRDESRINKQKTGPVMPRTTTAKARGRSVTRLCDEMNQLGVDITPKDDAHFNKTLKRTRSRSMSAIAPPTKKSRTSSMVVPRDQQGVKDLAVSVLIIFTTKLLIYCCFFFLILQIFIF